MTTAVDARRVSSTSSVEEFDTTYYALGGYGGACRWQYRLFADLAVRWVPTNIEKGRFRFRRQ